MMRWPAAGRPEMHKRGRVFIVRAYNPRHHRLQSFRTRNEVDALTYFKLCQSWVSTGGARAY
jgi:superfamily II helicase